MNLISTQWQIESDPMYKELFNHITIDRVCQIGGPDRYAIRFLGMCLSRHFALEFEPMPSNRTAAFFKRCRFKTMDEVMTALKIGFDAGVFCINQFVLRSDGIARLRETHDTTTKKRRATKG